MGQMWSWLKGTNFSNGPRVPRRDSQDWAGADAWSRRVWMLLYMEWRESGGKGDPFRSLKADSDIHKVPWHTTSDFRGSHSAPVNREGSVPSASRSGRSPYEQVIQVARLVAWLDYCFSKSYPHSLLTTVSTTNTIHSLYRVHQVRTLQ